MAKKDKGASGKRGKSRKKGTGKKDGPDLDRMDDGPGTGNVEDKAKAGPVERPAWKRIGLAVGVAIGINAALLPAAFIPIVGTIIALMLTPYLAAFVGGRWLDRDRRGEWLSATFWVVIIWSSLLTLLLISLVLSLGQYDLKVRFFGAMIITMIYMFPTIFSIVGFFHGSRRFKRASKDEGNDEKA